MSARPAVVFGLLHAGLAVVRALGRAGAPVTGIAWRGNEFGLSSRYVERARAPGRQRPSESRRRAAGHPAPHRRRRPCRPLPGARRERRARPRPLGRGSPSSRTCRFPTTRRSRAACAARSPRAAGAEKAGVAAPQDRAGERRGGDSRCRPAAAASSSSRSEGQEFAAAFGRRRSSPRTSTTRSRSGGAPSEHGFDTIVQELIPDSHDHICSLFTYVGRDGRAARRASSGARCARARSTSARARSSRSDDDPEVEEQGQRLLRSAGYTGFAHVELVRDPRDGDAQAARGEHAPADLGRDRMTRALRPRRDRLRRPLPATEPEPRADVQARTSPGSSSPRTSGSRAQMARRRRARRPPSSLRPTSAVGRCARSSPRTTRAGRSRRLGYLRSRV